jgi:hypothetical protein
MKLNVVELFVLVTVARRSSHNRLLHESVHAALTAKDTRASGATASTSGTTDAAAATTAAASSARVIASGKGKGRIDYARGEGGDDKAAAAAALDVGERATVRWERAELSVRLDSTSRILTCIVLHVSKTTRG